MPLSLLQRSLFSNRRLRGTGRYDLLLSSSLMERDKFMKFTSGFREEYIIFSFLRSSKEQSRWVSEDPLTVRLDKLLARFYIFVLFKVYLSRDSLAFFRRGSPVLGLFGISFVNFCALLWVKLRRRVILGAFVLIFMIFL